MVDERIVDNDMPQFFTIVENKFKLPTTNYERLALLRDINPDQWNNIPVPVMQAFKTHKKYIEAREAVDKEMLQ